jgi:crotonobetainyl-CoA:carnitine CoA-transferase CaiB-like acyl-CoA transferase
MARFARNFAVTSSQPKPLAGIRVLDLTRVLAGPWCTQLLADLGADVVKVERPEGGDDTRNWGEPQFTDPASGARETAFFLAANRGKRSIAVDLATEGGAALVRRLALKADVLVENFKAHGLAQYRLDADTLRAADPRLVYCSITGFGQTGPYADRPGYDYVVQGMGGLMSVTGWPDDAPGAGPLRVGAPLIDIMTGLYAANAISAALLRRAQTGIGAHIDLALLDVQLAVLSHQALSYLATGEDPQRWGNSSPTVSPYDAFPTADGHIIVTAGNDGQFHRFCDALGVPQVAADPRFANNALRLLNRAALMPPLCLALSQDISANWIAKLDAAGVPAGPINRMSQVLADPQIQHRQMQRSLPHPTFGSVPTIACPVRLDDEAQIADSAPPGLGKHTTEVLQSWLSESPSGIDRLLRPSVATQT